MTPEITTTTDLAAALAAFDPRAFGWISHGPGWLREDPKLGPIVICPLGWEHAMAQSYDLRDGERFPLDTLEFIVELQRQVWGMPSELLVPTNVMAIIPDGGGAVLAAYQRDKGFNSDGWLGFIIALGSSTGTYVSHMLGIREELRGAHDLGWLIKVMQGYEALKAGHHDMIWTFDPMRGANARLNLEKLAAEVDFYTIDKYGVLRSTLYGEVPSDRFTARWNLLSPAVHQRIRAVYHGNYRPLAPADLAEVEIAGPGATAPKLRYEVPGDIDELMRTDPERAIHWRQEIRAALTGVVTTKLCELGEFAQEGPVAVSSRTIYGDYRITGFATGLDDRGARKSWYLMNRTTGKAVKA